MVPSPPTSKRPRKKKVAAPSKAPVEEGSPRGRPEFQEVRRVTLAQSVTEQIIAMISDGYFRPGDLMPTEAEFMKQFNVGRSSVREAMRSLALIGVVDRRPRRGTVVVSPVDDLPVFKARDAIAQWALRDLFDARAVIEGHAALRAAELASDADLAKINRFAAAVEKKIAGGKYTFAENVAFHRAIVEASHNKVLVHLFDQIRGTMRDVRKRFSSKRDIAEHRAIVKALERRDGPLARKLIEDHVRTVVDPDAKA